MNALLYPQWLIADLQYVEQIVEERLQERRAVLSVIGPDVLSAHDSRLRAALVLLCSALGAYSIERSLHAAAAVELIHAAALTHTALVDVAARRRKAPPREGWDNGVTLMVGDYLYALAAAEMALAPDARVIAYYSQAVMTIAEAELAPVTRLTPVDEALAEFYNRADGRSAALIAAACRAGAASANLESEQIEALGRYGQQLGVAYLIAAEVADFADATGGASLRRGTITLPLIYAAHLGDAARLAAALDAPRAAERAWAIGQVRHFGLTPAREAARRASAAARINLAAFPVSEARALLESIAVATDEEP